MKADIDFWFDFASPYAWFMSEPLEQLAQQHGRRVRWRPVLLWTVLKQHGMPAPLENDVKRRYMIHDIERSARYFGHADFRMPEPFPMSSHLPARAYLQLAADGDTRALPFARAVFRAYFTHNADLRDPEALLAIGAEAGLDAAWLREALNGERGKTLLREAGEAAAAAGVWGSPYVIVDGEAYFGADRLPQIQSQLQGQTA